MRKYELRKSPIHGTGLFAAQDIKKGEFIIEYLGEIVSRGEANARGAACEERAKESGGGAVYIFELDAERCIDGNFSYNDARFINHACRTNCEAVREGDRILFYAARDIPAGEEILYNYAYPLESFLDHPCNCGFPECVGYIVSELDRKKLRRLLRGRKPNRPKNG
ncbi:MAG: SET domain-containing protein-lysine N-methyltransferase [Opitutales bacterium]|nr:SET domain-containing protein-lysine N-methyltransferase [Opitutales bacterium]